MARPEGHNIAVITKRKYNLSETIQDINRQLDAVVREAVEEKKEGEIPFDDMKYGEVTVFLHQISLKYRGTLATSDEVFFYYELIS